jgi:ATP-binding cassette subfamily B protein
VSDERVLEVLSELGLDQWLARLPDGLDTIVGRGGSGLSAGEGQLVALARVFLADPGVVVLDEASSRLDPATERLLDHAVTKLLQGRTGIVIAHRLTTLDRADQVIVLEDGRIVESGRRVDLIADPETRFSRLCRIGMTEVRP